MQADMNKVKVGDIFTSSSEIYTVVEVQTSPYHLDDPYFKVESFVAGSGWEDEGGGFTLLEAQRFNLELFTASNL